jgi:hypothetical protein
VTRFIVVPVLRAFAKARRIHLEGPKGKCCSVLTAHALSPGTHTANANP